MDIRSIGPGRRNVASALASALLLASLPAAASSGLAVAEPDALWPQWQARIAVQTASLAPVSLAGRPAIGMAGNAAPRGLQGGSLLGDYTFARPSFGAFRASGGLLVGTIGAFGPVGTAGTASTTGRAVSGSPGLSVATGGMPAPRVDLSVHNLGAYAAPAGGDALATVPYLGLGFSGAAWRSVAITADVGLVAERPSNAGGVGRAIFGNQGMDNAMRDLRLSPVLQLGVRYTF